MHQNAFTITPPDERGSCPSCRGLGPIAVWLHCYGQPEPPIQSCSTCGRRGVLVRVVASNAGREGAAPTRRMAAAARRALGVLAVLAAASVVPAAAVTGAGTDGAGLFGAPAERMAPAADSVLAAAGDRPTTDDPASVGSPRHESDVEVPPVALTGEAAPAEPSGGAAPVDLGVEVAPVELSIEVSLSEGRRLRLSGLTNLPDGAWITFIVTDEAWRSGHVDASAPGIRQGRATVREGSFEADVEIAGFGPGRVEAYVAFLKIPGDGQPAHVALRFGEHGERIAGDGLAVDGGIPRIERVVGFDLRAAS